MQPLVQPLQVFPGDVGVNLSGRNVLMPEHGLDRPQVRPSLQEMGGEGVAQHMGGDPLLNPRCAA